MILVYSFFETFFNVLSCSKQNDGENILQHSESLVKQRVSRSDDTMATVVKTSGSLGILKFSRALLYPFLYFSCLEIAPAKLFPKLSLA